MPHLTLATDLSIVKEMLKFCYYEQLYGCPSGVPNLIQAINPFGNI